MWTVRASSFPKKMSKPIANKANIIALDNVDSRWNNVLSLTLKQTKLMGKNLWAMMNQTLKMMLPQLIVKWKWWQVLKLVNPVSQCLIQPCICF